MTQDTIVDNHADTFSPPPLVKKISSTRDKTFAHCPWFCDPYHLASGEKALWTAVITQAVVDSLNRSPYSHHRLNKLAAIRWLTEDSESFRFVCLLADLDPVHVRRQAKKALLSPVRWRADAGFGLRYVEKKSYRERAKKVRRRQTQKPESRAAATIIRGPWQ